jgi:hypothetical protein
MELGRRRKRVEENNESIKEFFASKKISRPGGEPVTAFVKFEKEKIVENPVKDIALGERA